MKVRGNSATILASRREQRRGFRPKIAPGVIDAEIGAVQRAPDHEGPGRAVPQAAEHIVIIEIEVAPHSAARLPPSGM